MQRVIGYMSVDVCPLEVNTYPQDEVLCVFVLYVRLNHRNMLKSLNCFPSLQIV